MKKTDLVSYPARAEGLGKYDKQPHLGFELGLLIPFSIDDNREA